MHEKIPLSLSEIFGVFGVASIAYSVVKDLAGSTYWAVVAAIVVAFFGVSAWAIYRVAPRRHERFKMVMSPKRTHAINVIRRAKATISVTHFTRGLPCLDYTAAMLTALQKDVSITRIVSADAAKDGEARKWLEEFKKFPRYRELVSPRDSLPFEFAVIDELHVLLYLPIRTDPKLLDTLLIFENAKLAQGVCNMFEELKQDPESPVLGNP